MSTTTDSQPDAIVPKSKSTALEVGSGDIRPQALAQRPEGDTLSGLADLAGLSRKRAKEGLDTLLERGNREMEGVKLVG